MGLTILFSNQFSPFDSITESHAHAENGLDGTEIIPSPAFGCVLDVLRGDGGLLEADFYGREGVWKFC